MLLFLFKRVVAEIPVSKIKKLVARIEKLIKDALHRVAASRLVGTRCEQYSVKKRISLV